MEKWIAGHKNKYSVTTDGEVFSYIGGSHKKLKPFKTNGGHLVVQLGLKNNGTKNVQYIHYLVLTTFSSPRPKGKECRHLDGIEAHNELSNLLWGTRRENTFDKARHGSKISYQQKLTFNDVLRVRTGSEKIKDLAKEFEVTLSCLYKIRAGKSRVYF